MVENYANFLWFKLTFMYVLEFEAECGLLFVVGVSREDALDCG